MWASMWRSLLMALFQRFWRWLTVISRTKRLMMDVSSSVGEVVMLGAGSIEHRELIYYTVSKSTTFEPPWSGPGLGRVMALRKRNQTQQAEKNQNFKYHFHIPLSHTTAEINQKVVYTTFFR